MKISLLSIRYKKDMPPRIPDLHLDYRLRLSLTQALRSMTIDEAFNFVLHIFKTKDLSPETVEGIFDFLICLAPGIHESINEKVYTTIRCYHACFLALRVAQTKEEVLVLAIEGILPKFLDDRYTFMIQLKNTILFQFVRKTWELNHDDLYVPNETPEAWAEFFYLIRTASPEDIKALADQYD